MKPVPFTTVVGIAVAAAAVGVGIGFGAGLASTRAGASLLADLVESEAPADTAHPNTLDRERFSLSFPGNWTVDTADEDYDPDESFSIDSPGTAFVSFRFYALAMSPEDHVAAQQAAFTKLMADAELEPFARLGELSGRGVIMRGRMLTIPSTVKIFAHGWPEGMVLIVAQTPNEDAAMVNPGFALIEQTLRLRHAAAP